MKCKLRVAGRQRYHRRPPNYKLHVSACLSHHSGCEDELYKWVLGETGTYWLDG
jgi:hypothetical protein